MFGHAFKGQTAGFKLLKKFKVGEGVLYDLEYLTDPKESVLLPLDIGQAMQVQQSP